MPERFVSGYIVPERIVDVAGLAQRSFIRRRKEQMIGPIENQRPGFITHPFRERSRKTIPLE